MATCKEGVACAEMAKGYVLHEGPSPFDGQPIVSIATLHSSNRKTGDMVQTWILPWDLHPLDAVKTGQDSCICGQCPHRGSGTKRTCYVNVGQAPANIWRTYKAGGYAPISSYEEAVQGRVVRFGAYGDPAFMPITVVANLLLFAKGHTGYTHQWFQEFAADYKGIFMASVDSAIEEEMAQSQGWKTFRVYAPDLPIEGAKTCPAQLTDNRVQCERCLLCNGKKANIGIHAHGRAAKQVAHLELARR